MTDHGTSPQAVHDAGGKAPDGAPGVVIRFPRVARGVVVQFPTRSAQQGDRRAYQSVLLDEAISLLRDCKSVDCQVYQLYRRAVAYRDRVR